MIGGRLGARVAGSDHIVANQLTMYPNKMQAHVSIVSCVYDIACSNKGNRSNQV